jgi:predicted N-acetyltransferase YhbS
MDSSTIVTRHEEPADAPAVVALQREAFGPGAYARAAFRVRERAAHDLRRSLLTERGGRVIASVRMTPVAIGGQRGYLLGPLVVEPVSKGLGYGRALARRALAEAAATDADFVVLVGDEPYYGPLGFKPLPRGRITMLGPADPARILVAELRPGAAATLAGEVSGMSPQDAGDS